MYINILRGWGNSMNMLCFHGYGPIAGGISEYWKVWVSGQPVFPKDIAPIVANQFPLWRGERIYQKLGGILLSILYISPLLPQTMHVHCALNVHCDIPKPEFQYLNLAV
jgi:hypothetical protein